MASIRSRIGEKMEDRYLYKAKRLDNGEWEIGGLIALPTGEYEISNKCNNPPDCDPMWYKVVITHKVDPSTICQCTGLKDKNGNLIWENDIVAYWDTYSTENGHEEMDCIGKVVWDDETISFQVTNRLSSESYEVLDECSVIGNIFDNTELLESEE